jgi:hypothetical protein
LGAVVCFAKHRRSSAAMYSKKNSRLRGGRKICGDIVCEWRRRGSADGADLPEKKERTP